MREDIAQLQSLQACQEAVDFVLQHASIEEAWQRCNRGDWMLWLSARVLDAGPWTDSRRPLLRCCVGCLNLVSDLWTERTAQAIDLLKKWLDGDAIEVTIVREDSRTAVDHAQASAAGPTIAACSYADAVCLSASDPYINVIASLLSGACLEMASALPVPRQTKIITAVRDEMLKQTADIVRTHFPHSPI